MCRNETENINYKADDPRMDAREMHGKYMHALLSLVYICSGSLR
jgi:hypothetical protein